MSYPHMDTASDLWRASADSLRQPEPMIPSDYASTYVILGENESERPGSWDNNYYPALGPIMNIMAEALRTGRPFVMMKSAQGGGSRCVINFVCWLLRFFSGPILYMISTDSLAKDFGRDQFHNSILTIEHLRRKMLPGRTQIKSKRFVDGRIDIRGGQSVFNLQSKNYRHVIVDEPDSMKSEMADEGDPIALARKRQDSYQGQKAMIAFSHPVSKEQGSGKLYYCDSDQRRGFVSCVHCGNELWMRWTPAFTQNEKPDQSKAIAPKVAIIKAVARKGQTFETAERDASCYSMFCPHCAAEINDAQRVKMLRAGINYKSVLPEDEASKKTWIGVHFGQLYYPHKTVYALACEWIPCLDKESERITFIQKTEGEPYSPAVRESNIEDWKKLILTPDHPDAFRRGEVPSWVYFLTGGQDSRDSQLHYSIWGWGLRRNAEGRTEVCGAPIQWGVIDRRPKIAAQGDAKFSESDYLDFDELIFNRSFPRVKGPSAVVVQCLFDTSYEPTQIPIYRYCRRHPHRAVPIKGGAYESGSSAHPLTTATAMEYRVDGVLVKDESGRILNTYTLKTDLINMVGRTFKIKNADGNPREVSAIQLPLWDSSEDYQELLEHYSSEKLEPTGKRARDGSPKLAWRRKGPNHQWDNAVYSYAGFINADIWQMGLPFEEAEAAETLQREKDRKNISNEKRTEPSALDRYQLDDHWIAQ